MTDIFAMGSKNLSIGEIDGKVKRNKPFVMIKGRRFWIIDLGFDKAELRAKAKRWSDSFVQYSVIEIKSHTKINGNIGNL